LDLVDVHLLIEIPKRIENLELQSSLEKFSILTAVRK
jgi:hypothetical protein